MTTQLREELTALAETQPFSPDPSAWDRGRRARRNSRVARGAALLAVVAIVVGAIAVRPERAPVQPAGAVSGGALPSRIDLADTTVESPDDPSPFEDDFAIGRASVALAGQGNGLDLIAAEDGRHHVFGVVADVVALSPDGYRVAWWSQDGLNPDSISIADLRTGRLTNFAHNGGRGAEVTSLAWWPDSTRLIWEGEDDKGPAAASISMGGPSESLGIAGRYGSRGIPSPSLAVVALPSDGEVAAAPFLGMPTRDGGTRGTRLERALPPDLYPDGAVVTPVGWVDEDHVVAIIDPPPSDVVERPRLAVFTSPDVPESGWTYREFLPRLPPEATSFAVDLIPDLTGDPDQELTRDFTADPVDEPGWVSLVYGAAGILAVLLGLFLLATLGRRRP